MSRLLEHEFLYESTKSWIGRCAIELQLSQTPREGAVLQVQWRNLPLTDGSPCDDQVQVLAGVDIQR